MKLSWSLVIVGLNLQFKDYYLFGGNYSKKQLEFVDYWFQN